VSIYIGENQVIFSDFQDLKVQQTENFNKMFLCPYNKCNKSFGDLKILKNHLRFCRTVIYPCFIYILYGFLFVSLHHGKLYFSTQINTGYQVHRCPKNDYHLVPKPELNFHVMFECHQNSINNFNGKFDNFLLNFI